MKGLGLKTNKELLALRKKMLVEEAPFKRIEQVERELRRRLKQDRAVFHTPKQIVDLIINS